MNDIEFYLKNIPLYSAVKYGSGFYGHVTAFGIDEYGVRVKVMPIDESTWYRKEPEPIWVHVSEVTPLK